MGKRPLKLKILLIQLRQLGDILLTTPVIRALRQQYPDADIQFLTHPMGKLILEGNQDINQHLIYPTKSRWQQLKFLFELRSAKFDLVFDFMGNPRSALLTRVTGAKRRFSFASPRSWAYTGVISRESGRDYIVREKFRILAQAGVRSDDVRLMLPWTECDLGPWRSFARDEPKLLSESLRIALSPTHRRENRRWSESAWIQLADWLTTDWDANVIWLWGPGEEDEIRSLHGRCQTATLMAPKTTFRELAALIAQCDLFVGNSNGPSHVAVAVNTPSLQLHGPTDAPSWSPMTSRHRVVAKSSMQEIALADVQAVLADLRSRLHADERKQIHSANDVWTARPVL